MVKVSVIVPIYNAERYLKRCLDSIVNQTLFDIEIICIDDGSTDNSLEILNEYIKNDNRIKLIQQVNSGQGVARNKGIDIAEGEFIAFVDADDYIEPNMYQDLYNVAKKYDVDCVHCNYDVIYTENNTVTTSSLAEAMNIRMGKKIIYYDMPMYISDIKANIITLFAGPIWNKVYKSKIIKECHVYFPNCKMQEDSCFNVNAHLFFNRVLFVEKKYYNYCVTSKSISTGIDNVHFDIIEAFKALKQILEDIDFYKKYENYYQDYVYLMFLIHLPHIPEEQKYVFMEQIKPYIGSDKYDKLISNYLQ